MPVDDDKIKATDSGYKSFRSINRSSRFLLSQ